MNLVIDIGNTVAKLVAFDGETPVEEVTTSNKTLDALPAFVARFAFRRGIVSTVIDLEERAEMRLKALPFRLLRLSGDTPTPLQNLYRTPQTLGTDRLAAAVGAMTLKPGCDLLVIDAGTCLTYEFVDAAGRYHGGNISPGLNMRLQALHDYTGRLPRIDAAGDVPFMGVDTETAVRAGVIRGMQLEIEGYIRHFRQNHSSLFAFLTGGDSFDFDSRIKNIIFADRYLVPRGLNRILAYNEDNQ